MGTKPADELVPPVSHDPVPDLLENVIGASQYISPSYWLGWAAEYVTGTNPWAWVAGEVAGDWEAVQKAGVAIRKPRRVQRGLRRNDQLGDRYGRL